MGAPLTPQAFSHNGGAIAYTTTASGTPLAATANTAPCGQNLALLIKNASGSSINVQLTVPAAVTADGMAVTTPFVVAVANGADAIIPLPSIRYADPVTGLATFGFSATPTSVSAACITTQG
jgi:hypothetical protein